MLENDTDIDESIQGPLDYDQDHTLYLLRYALASYDAIIEQIEDWTCGECCNKTYTQKLNYTRITVNEELMAYTGYNADPDYEGIFVVFRGTDNPCNWICDDADVIQKDYVNPNSETIGKVETGFYESWRNNLQSNVATNITYLISQYVKEGDCKIFVTGHSLVQFYAWAL